MPTSPGVTTGAARDTLYRRLVDEQYAKGRAINMATTLEVDAVIDPAQTRHWLACGLATGRVAAARPAGIDPW